MKGLAFFANAFLCFIGGSAVAYTVATEDFVEKPVAQPIGVTASVGTPFVYESSPETMEVRWVNNPLQVRAVLDEYMAQNSDKNMITGLSMVINDACVIYAFKPKYEDSRENEILVHEFLHCFGMRHPI